VKRLTFTLIIALLILTTANASEYEKPPHIPDSRGNPNYSYLEKFNTKNKEVGTVESIIEYGDNSVIGVHYPILGKEKIDATTKTFIDKKILEFKNQVVNYKTPNNSIKAELNIDNETLLLNDKILSIKFNTFINMPFSTHTENGTFTLVYDLETQAQVKLKDFMNGDYLKMISQLAVKSFESNTLYSNHAVFDSFIAGTAPRDENFENFILEKDKIIFFFQSYQISPDATDTALMEIPYIDLQEFLNTQALLKQPVPSIPKKNGVTENQLDVGRKVDPKKPMVALTFDDGPNSKTTIPILDTLKANDAVATFYVIGNRISANKAILIRMINEGNEIGNHTYNHKQLTILTPIQMKDQINKTQAAIKAAIGITSKTMRPTYGSYNDDVKKYMDMPLILWSMDTRDWQSKNPKAVIKIVLDKVKDGDIILMHDIYPSTAEAVKDIVPKLKERGFQLVTVSELYEARGKALQAGNIYNKVRR